MTESYKHEPHGPWERRKNFAWDICGNCGLLRLRNALTAWAEKKGCNNELHPDWPRVRRELGVRP